MRFWITKSSEVSIREQLFRQVMLGILSEELPAGSRLPSIRSLARRCQIHSNTVSAAYHDLLDRGWLELRRGSGLYVRPQHSSGAAASALDDLLTALLRDASALGHEPDAVLHRLGQLVQPRRYTRIVVVEPEPGMREILEAELRENLRIAVEAMEPLPDTNIPTPNDCLFAALAPRAGTVREQLPRGSAVMTLRLRSVRGSLEEQTRPSPNITISVVSRSPEFRYWAHAILIAVGLDADTLCEVDANLAGWQQRASVAALVIADSVSARGLPVGIPVKIFRVIADSCIAELKQLCGE